VLDEFRSIDINWDRANNQFHQSVVASSGDANGRKLVVRITNAGQVEDLTGASLSLFWEHQSNDTHGLDGFSAIDASRGVFELAFTTEMLTNEGTLNARLKLVTGSGVIESRGFNITVFIGSDTEAVESSDSFTALTKALVDVQNLEQNYAPRLNEVTAQLKQKAKQTDVRLKSTPLGLDDVSEELLSAIQSGEGTTFNLLSEPRERSVTPSKTTFINTSTNLFNKEDIFVGKSILPTNGELSDNRPFYTTNYIWVNPSANYVSNRFERVAFYDENKNFISVSEEPDSFTTPVNAMYIRLHGYNKQLRLNPQINEGTSLLPFEEFKLTLSESVNIIVGNEDIVDNSISKEKTNFIKRSTNLYNPKTAIDGYYLKSTDGELVEDSQYITSDYILTNAKQLTLLGFRRTAFFDKDKNLISVVNYESDPTKPNVINVPENAKSFRTHINKAKTVENPQINEGATLLPYEEYYLTIDGSRIPEHVEPPKPKQYYFPPENLNGDYVTTNGVFEELDIVDLYAGYEALANANPNYITRKLLGKDASGEFDLFEYKLTPQQITSEVPKVRPKIVLVANVHGYEKPSAYSLYYMVKAICEDWKDNPILEYLRFNVEFVFIPLLNPYGFVNGDYTNANGVNIQVNFPTRWTYREDKPSKMHSGSEHSSEVETQYCMTMLNENKDAMIFVDLHAQVGTNEIAYSLIPDGVDYNLDVEVISKFTFEKLTRLFHKHYDYPIDEFIGRIDRREGKGTIDAYASSLGIPSTINEHFLKFKDEANSYSEKSIKANTDYLINWVIITLNRFKDVY